MSNGFQRWAAPAIDLDAWFRAEAKKRGMRICSCNNTIPEIGPCPHCGDDPAHNPVNGETLGQYRARHGMPGSDTMAARSLVWRDGLWRNEHGQASQGQSPAINGASARIRLYPSGTLFHPFDPRPEDIHIEDVAHALACINRFGGHIPEPYSVAQHCLVVALLMGKAGDPPFWGLLHEVAESLSGLGDVCGPTKRHPSIRGPIKALEAGIERAAEIRFGLPEGFASDPRTKRADLLAYAWEDRDFRGGTNDDDWVIPLRSQLPADVLVPMDWREAESEFLWTFRSLT